MTVDLVTLDKIAHQVFKNAKRTEKSLTEELQKIVFKLEKLLKQNKIKLISVEFKESRDMALIFKNKKVFSRRTDYAEDSSGDLFKIESTFDHKNQLTALKVFDCKNRIQEEFLF